MKKPLKLFQSKTITLYFLFSLGFIFFAIIMNFYLYKARAINNSITFTIKLQGQYNPQVTKSVEIISYDNYEKLGTQTVDFIHEQNSIFKGKIDLAQTLSLDNKYAFLIKPKGYLAKLFCTNTYSGECTQALIILHPGENELNYETVLFMGGDFDPTDGKVDAYDLSQVISHFGEIGENLAEDINNDLVVNGIDYAIVLKSLAQSAVADRVNLQFASKPTISPTVTIQPTNTPNPTVQPTTPPVGTGKCKVKLPSIIGGEEFMIDNNITTDCECSSVPFVGEGCAQASCTDCKSGICECGTLPAQMPPFSKSCSNGAKLKILNCSK